MNTPMNQRKKVVNRRAFLYGAGGVAIGLPFLEGLPERSAWPLAASSRSDSGRRAPAP